MLAYVVLVLAVGAILINQENCEKVVTTRVLPANHLLRASDMRSNAGRRLACDDLQMDEMAGRYLVADIKRGTPIQIEGTAKAPTFAVPQGKFVYWVAIKETDLPFVEIGTWFDICEGEKCPLEGARVEALRCAGEKDKRRCEVALFVSKDDSTKIQVVSSKSYRLLFRHPTPDR